MKLLLTILLSFIALSTIKSQDFAGVSYGSETRQFLDIYIAPSSEPTPVFIYAHPNGSTTAMPNSTINDLKAAGISTVSWESLTSVSTIAQVETGWDDADLMFAWVKANASTYNFDLDNIIIGGSSRGSILSWKIAHGGDPGIVGIYVYNALPDGIWAAPSWWYPPDEVTANSPSIYFVYGPAPGVADNVDSHDPNNGYIITDTYDNFHIGDRYMFVHSISTSSNTDRFQFLVNFSLSVINQVLPVELACFKGEVVVDAIQLSWQTISEINNEKFEVEESADGKVFQKIGEVAGSGTSSKRNNYRFNISTPHHGWNYYRLKQIDFNGRFEYSELIKINYEHDKANAVYPNPAHDRITINRTPATNRIEMLNLFGHIVIMVTVMEAETSVSIDISMLPNGIYFTRQLDAKGGQISLQRVVKN